MIILMSIQLDLIITRTLMNPTVLKSQTLKHPLPIFHYQKLTYNIYMYYMV